MELIEWTHRYIDYMNMYKPTPVLKEQRDNQIRCTYGTGTILYLIYDNLTKDILSKILKGHENVLLVRKYWQQLVKNKHLKILFVNPKLNMKWFIIPYLHNRVASPNTLIQGLMSLFESVPEVLEE